MAKGLAQLLRDYEKHVVFSTLKANGMDKSKTSTALQITRRALDKMLERHRLTAPRYAKALPIPRIPKESKS